jgi:F-type H+-transporting ATPase subunit epsilon
MKFLLEIITPERKAFSEEVDMVTAPTLTGTIGVLARHVPLFTSIIEGEVKITQNNREYYLAIGGGFMQVTKEKVTILVTRALHADELNEEEIEKAEKEASEMLARAEKGAERAAAQTILRRSILEMKVLRHRNAKNTRIN